MQGDQGFIPRDGARNILAEKETNAKSRIGVACFEVSITSAPSASHNIVLPGGFERLTKVQKLSGERG